MNELDLIKILNKNNVNVEDLMLLVTPELFNVLDLLSTKNKSLETLEIIMRSKKEELKDSEEYWSEIYDSTEILLS